MYRLLGVVSTVKAKNEDIEDICATHDMEPNYG